MSASNPRNRKRAAQLLATAVLGLSCACAADPRAEPASSAAQADGECTLAAGIDSAPRNVEAVVAMLDALPRPTSLSCFVQALQRPLRMQAIVSVFSAQPADGARSPRFLIFFDPLIMTVAPANVGRDLLEMGVLQSDRRSSVKAEIAFPLLQAMSSAAPYEQARAIGMGGTRCAACHREEHAAAELAPGYVSLAYRPRFADREVPLDELAQQALECDPGAEPERCALLGALFSGPTLRASFPPEMTTCFD